MQTVNNNKNGFVSIFVVIFSAVLISVVAIGFIRIMVSDQQQATTNDLSRSAYDSALAGVEDAKRALIKYQSLCTINEGTAECIALRDLIKSADCNASVRVLADVDKVFVETGEVNEGTVKTGDDNKLDQAYTCVKIKMDTDNYLGSLSQDAYKMIPLSAKGDFNTVQVDWFSAEDASSSIITLNNYTSMPLFTAWDQNTPPVLRAQFIQFAKSGFNLSQLNSSISNDNNNTGANTIFLYPSQSGSNEKRTAIDGRGELINAAGSLAAPQLIKCGNFDAGKLYSCSVQIELPAMIKPADQTAFLNLSAFYNSTNYEVTLWNVDEDSGNSEKVLFNGVQPEVDSTGRANDLFRRVKTRIEMVEPSYPYPEAAVDITGSLCKDFSVTDTSYIDSTSPCTE